jgi:peptide/nickel transport system substrate-binding protein
MRQPLRARTARVLAVAAIVGAVLAPATAVRAADPLILRAGTTQTVAGLNPWGVIDVVDFEIMTLNYDTLVGFGQDVEPVPGFAESWTRSTDGLTWTFKIRPGMKWSDGQPATSEDARWTMQYVLDATKAERVLGAGYLEPYQTAAGVTAVTAPDATTLVVTSNLNNPLLLQSYIPILPKHIWSKLDPKAASSSFQNPAPIVGTGPYQVVEYKPGQFVRLQRNANYWGQQGAADQIVITTFKSDDTMVQALKKGELDYARDVPAAQWDALKANPGGPIVTTEGVSNTFYELAFNCYTKPIKGGGASTTAVQDPAFRDALGYAIDKQAIITKAFNGHATLGSTQITPFQAGWHAEPNDIRAFSIDTAKAKLDAAGYALDASGKRLDKDLKPITLRLAWPGAPEEATAAALIVDWFAQLGIKVNAAPQDEAKLGAELLPPEADPPGKANFDMFIWDWVGDPDPTSLLKVLTTKEIGASSDSLWSNSQYDALYDKQLGETDSTARHQEVAQMQQIMYDEAPYHVLYYPSQLDANRTDRFGGWKNQPSQNGNPLFGFGPLDYTYLTNANAPAPSPSASAAASSSPGASEAAVASAPAATASAAPAPVPTDTSSTNSPVLLIVGIVVLVAALAVGFVMLRRGRADAEEE